MALIKCYNCGHEVSDTTNFCIHCGSPIKKENNSNKVKGIIKINYPLDPRITPKIKVFFNDNLIKEIVNNTSEEIRIDTDGILLFKGSFRKSKVEVKSNLNYEITLTWNILTGQLEANVGVFE